MALSSLSADRLPRAHFESAKKSAADHQRRFENRLKGNLGGDSFLLLGQFRMFLHVIFQSS
ncbi:MAG: hypothetical protein JWM68_5269, partial [Verrucomicrobiales bacterium]|nr:hypothetical protein [Verrucomicrobiales bacterium]